jgi:sugar O-acyltransferase (sialic acid O-acetyltransferase NeuD family)
MERTCVILGAGGHARMLLDILLVTPGVRVHGMLDPDRQLRGTSSFGVPILGGDELLSDMASQGVDSFVVGVGGVGDNRPRQRLFELGVAHGLQPLTVIHPAAVCSTRTVIGAGCQLLPGSIVNAGAKLGVNVVVNSGAIVEHDCEIGDHAHVATGARMASTVRVGERVHIGAGATVRQRITIEADAVVGAGAVVVKDVASGLTVVGVPAHPLSRSAE